MTMKPAELVADIDRRVRALERTRAALGGGGSGNYLPLAGGTMTGTLTGAGGTFTSLSVNGSPVATTSSLSSYLPLTGGTLSGDLSFSSASSVTFTNGSGPSGFEFYDGSGNLEATLYYRSSPNSWSFENASGDKIAEFDTDDLSTTLGSTLQVLNTGRIDLKGTDTTYPNSFNLYGTGGSNYWHFSAPRQTDSDKLGIFYYTGSAWVTALTMQTNGQVNAATTLTSPRVNTDLIGTNTGQQLGIGAGETAGQMSGNLSGEHLWLGAEGNVNLVTSPDNWASGWAGRYETHLQPQGAGDLRVTTDHGYIDLGPKNSGWCHIYTDMSAFYFNKWVSMAGGSAVRGTLTLDGKLTANAGITLRSADGAHDSIERVGGVFFTWDSDNYGTNSQHSIRSTNGDSWGDSITINSFGNIRMNIDSNGNGTNTFTVGRHTTATANTLLTLDESGNHTVTGRSRAHVGSSTSPSFSFNGDTNTGIYRVANGQLGVSCNGTVHTFKNDGLHLSSGDWFRSYGTAGWYSQTYGGGWHMTDTTWLRAYGNKGIYTSAGTIRSDKADAFMMPNATTTWSYNTVRYNTSNGQLMPYASLGSMKTDITEVQPLLDYLGERSLLYDLRPVIFREADDRTDHEGNPVTTTRGEYAPGFIAEEVHDVAPELTYPDRHGDLISYAPDALVPHVVAELQRLMPMVETLWQAHDPTWTPPTPRPAERADAERAVYELAAEYARTHPLEDPSVLPDDFEDPAAELEVLEDPPTEPTQEDDQTHE